MHAQRKVSVKFSFVVGVIYNPVISEWGKALEALFAQFRILPVGKQRHAKRWLYTLEWNWRKVSVRFRNCHHGDACNHDGERHSRMNFHFNLDLALELFPVLSFSFRLKLELSCAPVSLEDNHAQSPWWPFDHVSHPSSAKSKRLIARINSSVTVVRYSTSIFGLHRNYWVPAKAKKEKSLPTISTGSGVLLCYTLPRHSGVKS